MSQPSRPHARGSATRRPRRRLSLDPVQPLEDRKLPAPVIPTGFLTAEFDEIDDGNDDTTIGTVSITSTESLVTSAAPYTSVAQLTPSSAFGGDIVRIEAGPGGDFGKAVYAISRGAGGNTGAINKPGVIYRVDPATGKASIFFDLNTVLNVTSPGSAPGNSLGAETGLVNWYDITFDPEGIFDGKPSMFVSSVDRLNPEKNAIYRIGPDGAFLGAYIKFSEGTGAGAFRYSPSSVLIPPVEQQSFLRGMLVGDGSDTGDDTFTGFLGLFFNANEYRPGTPIDSPALPPGVTETGLFFGPMVGLTSANSRYVSPVYMVFSDFGDPPNPLDLGQPGLSGLQGLFGDLPIVSYATYTVETDPGGNQALRGSGDILGLIGTFPIIGDGTDLVNTAILQADGTAPSGVDQISAIGTPYRRFQDIAFDHYGYFSYGTETTTGGTDVTVGLPTYAGNLFISDLANGLAVDVPLPPNSPITGSFVMPVQGGGVGGISVDADGNFSISLPQGNLGGRIIRVNSQGVVSVFAENFNTSGSYFSDSFIDSSLSITFSADGTILYASDNDGIWQFMTVNSLANSTAGTIVGLNDLRALGVPYEGQDSAVAILDTGVDALTPYFRGRVAPGFNVLNGGPGNDDPTPSDPPFLNGHGTELASVVAQFVPQATLVPVNVVSPNLSVIGTDSQQLWRGLNWLHQRPLVQDPVRANKLDRIIATSIGLGTAGTFDTEATAFRYFKQVVLALKGQSSKLRRLGNQVIASTGEYGVPFGSGLSPDPLTGDVRGMSLPAVLNEVISVTGSYSFPYTPTPRSTPDDEYQGALPRPIGPVQLIGDVDDASTGAELLGQAGVIGAGDNIIYADKILATANRSYTTDFTAPAMDVPVFRRTFAGDLDISNIYTEAGTFLSAGMVTGSYAVVASAIDYWTGLALRTDAATVDAYLTVPVGVNTLTFGTHSLVDLSAYATPDAINSILQWTAVPAVDQPNFLDVTQPYPLFGSDQYSQYARVDVGNAIAAIEGTMALNYLIANGGLELIDTNKNGLITAQEIQSFVDNSATIGVPELGAMARLLGGTATYPRTQIQPTVTGAFPDTGETLQRRYNFFDYAADGQLNGAISIEQLNLLAHKLLPSPDAFTVTDRQRASNNGFLVSPPPLRNYKWLQHLLPNYVWVSPRLARRFENISPGRAGVGRLQLPGTITPFFTLSGIDAQTAFVIGGNSPGGAPGTGTAPGGGTGGGGTGGGTGGGGTGGGGTGGGTGGGGTITSSTPGTTTPGSTNPGTATPSSNATSRPATTSNGNSSSGNLDYRDEILARIDELINLNRSLGQTSSSATTLSEPKPAGTVSAVSETSSPVTASSTSSATETTPATPTSSETTTSTSEGSAGVVTTQGAVDQAAQSSAQNPTSVADPGAAARARREQILQQRKSILEGNRAQRAVANQSDDMEWYDWANPVKVFKKIF